VTLRKNGVDVQVPLTALDSLSFTRTRVVSTLPPYVASEHYRHAATAVLRDGTRLDGDYVNLGTSFLRGRAPQQRVDIPWQDIETVRFTR
jgi:hypothetical protein